MMKMVKSLVLALGLILTPSLVMAQDQAPVASTQTEAAATAADSATATEAAAGEASGYERMKPTPGIGMPVDKGLDFQEQFTENGRYAKWINNAILLPIITIISLFVLLLMLWAMFRFRRNANPDPSKTTHNTFIEIIWTLVPVLILVAIAIPSIDLLAKQYKPAPADALTVKVTGYQWYWGYEYPDNGIEVIANMSTKEEADANGEPYLLAADNRLVLPAGVPIKLIVTSADVIHSFAVPAFWFKIDAVPGRLNERTLTIEKPGVFYGQCSELCGARHGFMPVAVEALPKEKFDAWVLSQGGKLGTDEETAEGEEAATEEVAAAETNEAADAAATATDAPAAN